MMNASLSAAVLAAALAAALPGVAHAHRSWLLPSATVLSGNEPWVTVDAASSTDPFNADHNPMPLERIGIVQPDGSAGAVENGARGRYRSVFDVKLSQPGTYKVAAVNDMLTASWRAGQETKRTRGTADSLAREIPADAQDLRVTRAQSRLELFVTAGKPNTRALQPTGRGLEMEPVTHPNDLVVGERARLRFLLDGRPAAGASVTLVRGGIRYRDRLDEQVLVTDAKGEVAITFTLPGMYWLGASPAGQNNVEPVGGMGGDGASPAARGPAGTLAQPARRDSYSAVLEVLPQ